MFDIKGLFENLKLYKFIFLAFTNLVRKILENFIIKKSKIFVKLPL
jgi:hypothetical protein